MGMWICLDRADGRPRGGACCSRPGAITSLCVRFADLVVNFPMAGSYEINVLNMIWFQEEFWKRAV